jgi:N-acetyl-anhydromuramyl-L-alanine amidase AmpD
MVCGEKQLQVNGSFADMFRVYERLQKEYPGLKIDAYLLDNGSYNLPIWSPTGEITQKMISEHLKRNVDGGTALVLMNDGAISPYEYRNKYQEFQHVINRTLDENTGQPLINEHSVIVLHHTGNYVNPQEIINTFENPANEKSAHVVIFKDGTRHIFDDDNAVLSHAGKSVFGNREKVNLFSLGIEIEGDSVNGHQFTLAQLESLLEYLRPRIEKYNISFENITDHKTIRENWFLAHPDRLDDEGNIVQGKRDLDEKVFEQIQELIKKKLYTKEQTKLVDENGKLVSALAYQDEYRKTKNEELALHISAKILKDFSMSNTDIDRVQGWIRNFT